MESYDLNLELDWCKLHISISDPDIAVRVSEEMSELAGRNIMKLFSVLDDPIEIFTIFGGIDNINNLTECLLGWLSKRIRIDLDEKFI